MISTCTLVLEYNHVKPGKPDRGSVWVFNGDASADLKKAVPMESLPGWVRIAGPMDYESAGAIHASLKRFFLQEGVAVIDEGIAD